MNAWVQKKSIQISQLIKKWSIQLNQLISLLNELDTLSIFCFYFKLCWLIYFVWFLWQIFMHFQFHSVFCLNRCRYHNLLISVHSPRICCWLIFQWNIRGFHNWWFPWWKRLSVHCSWPPSLDTSNNLSDISLWKS